MGKDGGPHESTFPRPSQGWPPSKPFGWIKWTDSGRKRIRTRVGRVGNTSKMHKSGEMDDPIEGTVHKLDATQHKPHKNARARGRGSEVVES